METQHCGAASCGGSLPLLQKGSKCAVHTPSGTAGRMGYKTEWKHRPLLRPLYEQCAIPLDLSQGGILLLPLLRNGSGGIKAVLSAVLSVCSIRMRLRNGTQAKTPSPLMKYPPRPQKRPGLSAKTAGLNIKASYRTGPGAKDLTAHIVQGKK